MRWDGFVSLQRLRLLAVKGGLRNDRKTDTRLLDGHGDHHRGYRCNCCPVAELFPLNSLTKRPAACCTEGVAERIVCGIAERAGPFKIYCPSLCDHVGHTREEAKEREFVLALPY